MEKTLFSDLEVPDTIQNFIKENVHNEKLFNPPEDVQIEIPDDFKEELYELSELEVFAFEEIAKLSRDLLKDYDYFKQFHFKSRFANELYDKLLKRMGYEGACGFWGIKRRPRDVLLQRFIYVHLINQIIKHDKKQSTWSGGSNSSEENQPVTWTCTKCTFINRSVSESGSEKCRACLVARDHDLKPDDVTWQCWNCSHRNWPQTTHCVSCGYGQSRPTTPGFAFEVAQPPGRMSCYMPGDADRFAGSLANRIIVQRWLCIKCDLLQKPDVHKLKCGTCNEPRYGPGIKACPHCDFMNNAKRNRCVICRSTMTSK